jgi:hypothetical protein
MSAFTFTHWQNSNETEVYSVATFTIALICWLCLRWRRCAARSVRPAHPLSCTSADLDGNHLLALLAGLRWWSSSRHVHGAPAVGGRAQAGMGAWRWWRAGPSSSARGWGTPPSSRDSARGRRALRLHGGCSFALLSFAVAASASPPISSCTSAPAVAHAQRSRPPRDALLAVIRREQYPVGPAGRSDVPHGLNPGRSLTIIWLQIQNYLQYFNWQWARGAAKWGAGILNGQVIGAALVTALGLGGLVAHRRADRAGWWLLFTLFLVTGIGLVAYMNFKPGASLGYDLFPESGQHEVRERDYFFVVSFLVWGVWAASASRFGACQLRPRSAHGAWRCHALLGLLSRRRM